MPWQGKEDYGKEDRLVFHFAAYSLLKKIVNMLMGLCMKRKKHQAKVNVSISLAIKEFMRMWHSLGTFEFWFLIYFFIFWGEMTYLLYFIYLITFRCNLSEEAKKESWDFRRKWATQIRPNSVSTRMLFDDLNLLRAHLTNWNKASGSPSLRSF